jgi:deoxyinosine 3'endonuclease (endonuclease V)
MTEPYISGFSAFREVHHLKGLIDDLKVKHSMMVPQLIMVDGNGILHPRKCGLASHLGVICNIPTIGIGKNLLNVDGLDKQYIQEWRNQTNAHMSEDSSSNSSTSTSTSTGSSSNRILKLIGTSGQCWGAALCIGNVLKPIYVSVGHRISLETALKITIACSEFRIPTPVRAADLGSRNILRKMAATAPEKKEDFEKEENVTSKTN